MAAAADGDLRVIVGEEISTTAGHVIGLFLREQVEPGMSPRDTALAIREQGVTRGHSRTRSTGCSAAACVGASARSSTSSTPSRCATPERLVVAQPPGGTPPRTRTDFLGWSGWTWHHGDNLDACYQVLDPFDGPAGFLRSVRRAHLARGRHDLPTFCARRCMWFSTLTDRVAGNLRGQRDAPPPKWRLPGLPGARA